MVRAGQTADEIGASSKPTTEMSSGMRRPILWATEQVAAAISSLEAKMAVGRSERDNSFSAASMPLLKVNCPSAIYSLGGRGKPWASNDS